MLFKCSDHHVVGFVMPAVKKQLMCICTEDLPNAQGLEPYSAWQGWLPYHPRLSLHDRIPCRAWRNNSSKSRCPACCPSKPLRAKQSKGRNLCEHPPETCPRQARHLAGQAC